MVVLGIILHAIGGFAAGSFYIPFKKVRSWSWESFWITGGFFSWLITPWVVAFVTVPQLFVMMRGEIFSWSLICLTVPQPFEVLKETTLMSVFFCYFFGILWGIGGITFGLSMRYLGLSLGYATSLGCCAAFGTLMVPLYKGEFYDLLITLSGRVTLSGVLLCLVGIAVCGYAGMSKERELSAEKKKETIKEFNFKKGIIVAVIAGVLSACMNFGIFSGERIAQLSIKWGTLKLWSNSAVFVVVLTGGFTTNFLWCMFLNFKNNSSGDYTDRENAPLLNNYFFCALAGITWYLQFMFYGMGTTKMGKYDFASWTIHMAFIIIFSNIWALFFREWKDVSKRILIIIISGITIVLLSVIVVGAGNYLQSS